MKESHYLCIDLKSFYASVECVERGLDPMKAKLVVADPERSDKTICLAVSPALKALGVKNRCRVFEIPPGIDYIMAEPQMQKYIDYAAEIYGIYLSYISKEDIHVYSVDEAFLDVTPYLGTYGMTPRELGQMLMKEVLDRIGIRATCGIGTNLYLTKVALDILAKRDRDFVGELNEESYRRRLWNHRPLTDFWRIGRGTAQKLQRIGIDTMGKLAHTDEEYLYSLFGVDAELLIDHAWGRETATMADIKSYRPDSTGMSSGQVLMRDYSYEEGKLILKEMVNQLCLRMVQEGVVTSSIGICVGYSKDVGISSAGLSPARGTASLSPATNISARWMPAAIALYDRIVDPNHSVRRFNLSCNHLKRDDGGLQLNYFDIAGMDLAKEQRSQQAVLEIQKKYGKNALFRGMDLTDAATTLERNNQIGGHKSGIEKK